MRKFYQIASRRFCTNYHHDFIPREELKKPATLLTLFDFGRVMLYAFVAGAFLVQLPGYFIFSKKNFKNNPDYLMFDRETLNAVKKI